MFDKPEWSDGEENLFTNVTPESGKKKKMRNKNKNKKAAGGDLAKSGSLTSLNGSSENIKNFASSVKKKVDKCFNSPSLSKKLIDSNADDDVGQTPVFNKNKNKKGSTSSLQEVGSILRKGIKFASEAEFDDFRLTKKKRKHDEDEDEDSVEDFSPKEKNEKVKKTKKSKIEKTSTEHQEEKAKSESKFDIDKLKELLSKESNKPKKDLPMSKHTSKLKSAHFRHLNEQLYTQTGSQSLKMFTKDPDAFEIYHQGFMEQSSKWPVDPVNLMVAAIMKMPGNPVVADFGCGEARLARALQGSAQVHSFDLVKLNEFVTVCDFSNTPLEDESCDVVVFCLSLMGTNLKDFLKEANRVLKTGGTMKIAEVASRFKDLTIEDFIQTVAKYGFQLKWKDVSKDYFYLLDMKRIARCKKKTPEVSLKPCLYKKR